MKCLIHIVAILLFFNTLQGQIISNGSFEDADTDPGLFIVLFDGSTFIHEWTVVNSLDYVGTLWPASDGDRSLDLNSWESGTIYQSFATEVGETYQVEFDMAGNPAGEPNVKTIEVSVANETAIFSFDVTGFTLSNIGWEYKSFEFTANDIYSTINFLSLTDGFYGPALDNVQILKLDCLGIPGGTAVIDECGVCLQPYDPDFNQSCLDCEGTINGTAIIDDCGECLQPNDPNFNQSCLNCEGTINGTTIIDDFGECLQPNDPEFNQTCLDCEGTINGTAIIDDCGECLQPDDSNFNQSCLDCEGIINGNASIDDCGECLQPDDPNFNQSCLDCEGTINGTAIIDDCGECLQPDDSNFNQSCLDCEGTVNGTAVIDDCGECLQPNAPEFNQSCSKDPRILIPNIFSPNNDGVNDKFKVYKRNDVLAIITQYRIYSRWGELLFEDQNIDFDSNLNWWQGDFNGKKVQSDVYVYYIEVEFHNGEIEKFFGDLTLLK